MRLALARLLSGRMPATPAIIYLDTFVWIDLARRYLRPSRSDRRLVETLLEAAGSGHAILPLSAHHIIETNRRIDLRSRRDVIKTLIAFSRGWFIAPVATVAPQEIRNALPRLFCLPAGPDVNVLGRGLPFAFGRSGHLDEGG